MRHRCAREGVAPNRDRAGTGRQQRGEHGREQQIIQRTRTGIDTCGSRNFARVSVTARSIKTVMVLDPAATLAALRPFQAINTERALMEITVEGRRLRASLSTKSVRKVINIVKEHGVEHVTVLIQGRLMRDDEIAEAGLTAQPKIAKPAAAVATPTRTTAAAAP
jgi:hypothetical protein